MRYVVGIDEVGRGCLAGPVTVTACAVPVNLEFKISNLELKDSKKLTAIQREEWFRYIKQQPEILYCVASVSPKVIDKINISAAANLAAYRAVSGIQESISESFRHSEMIQISKIFLDGGLYIKDKQYQREFFANAETVIKGDEKIKAVSLASIVAKVSRDRYMKKLHAKHPRYQLDVHKGYGTKVHRAAIKKYGISKMHRKTFTHRLTRQ